MAGSFNLRGVGAIELDPNPILQEGIPAGVGELHFDANQGTLVLRYLSQGFFDVTTALARGESAILASNVLTGKSGMFGIQEKIGALYLPAGDLSGSTAYLEVSNQQGQQAITFTVEIVPVGGQVPVATFSISAAPEQTNSGVVSVTNPLPLTEGWYGVLASTTGFGAPCLIGGIRLWVVPVP